MPSSGGKAGFIQELKRRNVIRVATAYVVVSWLIIQVVETIAPAYGFADNALRLTIAVLAIAFVPTLVFSWVFEITPEGLKREVEIDREASITRFTGKKIDRVIMVLLALALGYFAFDKFVLQPERDAELVAETAQQARAEALVESYGDQSIAVLPFANLSDDEGNAYFSDGVSEELLNLLAKIPGLRVISKSSAFSFKGEDIPIAEVARLLKVAHVLDGSIRRAENRVRISAQLVDARSDTQLWADSFDRELDDIFAVQDEIAAAISDALAAELVPAGGRVIHPESIRASNTAAYDAYLQGREAIYRRGEDEMRQAYDHLRRALRLDEEFAPAHALYAIAMMMGGGGSAESAIEHLDRAQELAPDLAEVHAGRALMELQTTRDPVVTIEHASRALAANPSLADAMNWKHIAQEALGQYREADQTLDQMLLIDPATIIGRYNYAINLAERGEYTRAHEVAEETRNFSSKWAEGAHADIFVDYEGKLAQGLEAALRTKTGHLRIIWAFVLVGEYDEARRIDEEFNHWVDQAEGKHDATVEFLKKVARNNPEREGTNARAAVGLVGAGRLDEALPYLEKAFSFAPEGRPFFGPLPLHKTLWLALARRQAGDEEGALVAAEVARQDLAARRDAGRNYHELDQAEAMIAAFDGDDEAMYRALGSAVDKGLRDRLFLVDPSFGEYADQPRMMAIREKLEAILSDEHAAVIQLVCFDNPVPEDWQPLPATCAGVRR